MRKRNWPIKVKAGARKMRIATRTALDSMANYLVDSVRAHGGLSSWEKPCYEVHGAHGHADSEDNAGKDSLGLGVTNSGGGTERASP